jgi:hypothetical protein
MAAAHAVLRHVRTLAVRQRTLRGISHRRLLTTTILSQMPSCKLSFATAATILSATFTVTEMAWDTTSRNSPAIRLRQTFGAVRVLFTPGSHYGPLEKQVSLDCTGGSPSLRCPGEGATRTGL